MTLVRHDSSAPAAPQAALSPLVAILGPTASGKSALAVVLAQRFGGEVLACDSTQVYRGFDIGTGKPTKEERGGIAHHLMDLIDPTERFTAGEYRRRAEEVLADLAQRKRLPIFTVGTGLYLRALLEGLSAAPERCDALRARLDAIFSRRGSTYLHRMLQRLDPAAAARISPQDRQKLVRSLEICLLAGRPLTELYRAGRDPLQGYAAIKIGLNPPRTLLRERIKRRVHTMLDHGWLNEAAELISRQPEDAAKPLEFLGYGELRAHLQQAKPLAEAMEAIVHSTRRYAKRQLTWFHKEPGVQWFQGFGDDQETLQAVSAHIEHSLAASTGFSSPEQ